MDHTVHVTARDGLGNYSVCTFIVSVIDADGLDNEIENNAPNDGDGNFDGIPDAQQHDVASLTLAGSGFEDDYVTIETSAGTLRNVSTLVDPSDGWIEDLEEDFPLGFVNFEVHDIPNGSSVVVTLYFHDGLPANVTDYYKWGVRPSMPDEAMLYRFPQYIEGVTPVGAEIVRSIDVERRDSDSVDRIILHLTDGELGDSTLEVNGVIADPGTPGPSDPLLIDLVSFTAESNGVGQPVTLRWETAAELDNVGFHLYRAIPNGSGGHEVGERLTAGIIPAEGTPFSGANYEFSDELPLTADEVRAYYLEDIDTEGVRTFHGPAFATEGDQETAVPDWMLID